VTVWLLTGSKAHGHQTATCLFVVLFTDVEDGWTLLSWLLLQFLWPPDEGDLKVKGRVGESVDLVMTRQQFLLYELGQRSLKRL